MEETKRRRVMKIRMESFPTELTTQILSMLSVKYVLRCRSVCKAWRDLIDDHPFAALHLDREIQSTGNRKSTFIILSKFFSDTLYLVEQEDEKEDVYNTIGIALPIPDTDDIFTVGFVNGICCFAYYGLKRIHTLISNPFTQKIVKLPGLVYAEPNNTGILVFTGFGYDSLSTKFKVLVMILRRSSVNLISQTTIEAHVFTMGSSSWKKLDNAPNVICVGDSVFVSGSLHWSTNTNDSSFLSFNLSSEDFGFIPFPELRYSVYRGSHTNLDGCLCIFDWTVLHVDIWVMKDYGVRESWTKFVVVQRSVEKLFNVYMIEPISIWKDGEILMLCKKGILVSYNLESGKCTHVVRHSSSDQVYVYPYCGSLISLQSASQK